MNYLSICSGIEAATVAWHPLGWDAVAYAEIEAFPSAVLAHHYPSTPNWGDITKFKDWPDADVDVLVGGTPCQSFSVAGLRKGLADPRGNLALVYPAIADRYRPEWLVWENVPGVLSSSGGRDFGAFIGGLAQLGYHAAWRVLDAQYVRVDGLERAVPQRRRRVFVVGHLGDWRRSAAVLFERQSLSWDYPPRREAGQRVADHLTVGANQYSGFCGEPVEAAKSLNAHGVRLDTETETETFVSHALRADGFDASEDGTGRGTPLVPTITFPWQQGGTMGFSTSKDVSHSLIKNQTHATAYDCTVRRLTPTECERLQGFPDGYTAIPHRGKPAADGPRYKALGNSMACNAMRWIGQRIALVHPLMRAA